MGFFVLFCFVLNHQSISETGNINASEVGRYKSDKCIFITFGYDLKISLNL